MKGVMRFGKKGKLSPRYIGPYRISKSIGNVAYKLELPQELAAVHPVFHIFMLKKCMGNPSLSIPIKYIGIKDNLSYEEIPIQILDNQVCKLRTNEVALVKVLCRNQFVEEATWEAEEDMKKRYPHLFETGDISDQGAPIWNTSSGEVLGPFHEVNSGNSKAGPTFPDFDYEIVWQQSEAIRKGKASAKLFGARTVDLQVVGSGRRSTISCNLFARFDVVGKALGSDSLLTWLVLGRAPQVISWLVVGYKLLEVLLGVDMPAHSVWLGQAPGIVRWHTWLGWAGHPQCSLLGSWIRDFGGDRYTPTWDLPGWSAIDAYWVPIAWVLMLHSASVFVMQVQAPFINVEFDPTSVYFGDEIEDSSPLVPLPSSSRTGFGLPIGGLVGAIMAREIG
ncbi:hypothetical protein MTR67_039594 [Solanum verrucosum]|uniref:Tf2-1-like SH3-like domain-containing protein n=1 Tax=Solanum verrucosum TaxID=315347 RepID=A0AAF0UHZ9_SOLVR|nr:hypothetical protein MTR67_039594 [Solanum verrucosum]